MKNFTLFCAAVFMCSATLTFAGNRTNVIIPGDHFPTSFRLDPKLKEGDYFPNKVIFKVKPQYRQNCKVNSIDNILRLQDLLNSVGAQGLAKIYPDHRAPQQEYNEVGLKLVDISLIYSFTFTSNLGLEKVINEFLALGYFEFVEPWYIPKFDFIPNDPSYSNSGQYFVKGNNAGSVDAQTAWNTTTGSSSVVIGIVDTGTLPTHPDLAANYLGGYDVAMQDADPTWDGVSTSTYDPRHGVAVSGDADAVTNNSTGVASPGYNCKFKCAKVATTAGVLTAGYEGITWAADNGCKIINCSWGGAGGGTYGQTIVDYATINKNCLLITSAGNGGVEEFLYPSSYNNTYRVASTTSSDAKSGFSSYGIDVDYGSPGSGIYSTFCTGATPGSPSYSPLDGTSMASPVSAGVAGLIQSKFNYTNAFQIGERMKQTCDPYSASAATLFNAGKLGKGRIDAANAVSSAAAKSIVLNPVNITDGGDNIFMPGESLTITGTFINYLDPSSASAAAVLSVVSGPGTITSGNYTIGALATLGTKTITTTPFTVSIQAGAAINSVIKFKVAMTDAPFSGNQYFEITVNPDYINIINNDVHTSITSTGRLGFNLDGTLQGLGFDYQLTNPTTQMLYEMSLMIGTSSTAVSDMFREVATGNTDFASATRVYQVSPATVSDFDVDGKYTDAPAPSPIPVQVHQSAYAWSTAPYRKFVIVKYVIKNTSASTLNNLAVGILADWDIADAAKNKGGYDAANKMGYCYDVSTASGTYAGIKLLTSGGTANNYIVDHVAGGNGGIDVTNATTGFTTALKYTTLSTARNTDGYTAAGGDVFDCMSAKGLTINANDSITVAFALIGGDNLADIQLSACAAQSKYDGTCLVGINDVENDNFWMYNYPNPVTNAFNIDYNFTGSDNASIRIMNTLGEVVMAFENITPGKNTLTVDASKFSSGNYFYQLRAGEAVLTKKLTVVK